MIALKLKYWMGDDRPTPMLQNNAFDKLTGEIEYEVRVRSSIGDFTRRVCEVECLHPNKPPMMLMADTMTGSLYKDGKCLSGNLRFVGKPKKTGNRVPSWAARQRYGQQVVALSNMVTRGIDETQV